MGLLSGIAMRASELIGINSEITLTLFLIGASVQLTHNFLLTKSFDFKNEIAINNHTIPNIFKETSIMEVSILGFLLTNLATISVLKYL